MITKTVKNNRKKTFTAGITSILEVVYDDDEVNDIMPLPPGTHGHKDIFYDTHYQRRTPPLVSCSVI